MRENQGGVPHVIYYIIVIFIIICSIYVYFHNYVVNVIFFIKLFELKIINLITENVAYLINWINNTPTEAVTVQDIYAISNITGSYIRWLAIPMSAISVLLLWKFHPTNKLSEIHDMKSLLLSMRFKFSETMPIIGKNLNKKSVSDGAWKMALTPVEFIKENRLLLENKKIDRDLAKHIFTKQLGKPWSGSSGLTTLEKAMFGILAAFACYDRASAESAMSDISMSIQEKSIDYTLSIKLYNKYYNHKNIKEIIKLNYYNYTVFSSLLQAARQSGIVSTAQFLWLKEQDRSLWYCLNNVGRQAVFIEAAGIRSHWLAESHIGGPIALPVIHKSIDGLEDAIKNIRLE
ncbi:type IVB secretion system coupling complex protein DotM/IcmP [Piscirickettsia litoralis]|uniref:DotM C-terminal cytoplasmic domain-containing protein n=1 Tax=Piscirickettsia litoralis TaxID=1891921 RepID=A0ABX3A4U4_9GAMM|nr:type IVB secretion system coupling complex protein DotM/IcmP [Piscirickettsia litoralis]ODN43886.1 hypothetical protein BGC07_14550 [Piscirickettsia litoralis]